MNQNLLKNLFDYDELNGGLIWKVKPSHRIEIGSKFGFNEGGKKPYIKGMINRKTYREHRLVWIWHYGEIPSNLIIDHINRCHYDNRIENLRLTTHSVNMKNRKDNFFKYKQ